MRSRRTIGAAAALLLAAGVLGACGDEGSKQELSNRNAASLRSILSEVEQSIEAQNCSGAGQRAAALRTQVESLPDRVDADLRNALEESAGRLESLIADQCQAGQQAPVQEAPSGTTTEDQVQQPENNQDQSGQGKKDKKPKKEKPAKDEQQPPPDTGGAGEEDQGLDQQGGGTVPPGQE